MKTSKPFAREFRARSPLPPVTEGPVFGAIGLRRFRELGPSAADVVSRRFLMEHGAEYRQFGARGHEACRVDLAYHLEFLVAHEVDAKVDARPPEERDECPRSTGSAVDGR